ncbi:hypothetical protein U9M48_025168 [Paspalum notatum var. saurae]|uniref:DUF4408 domain-containing protein n=1 Tax=Paspalum notatum var. saurae TaxID=547442 RepID=A0AAQ3TPU5_PASNO
MLGAGAVGAAWSAARGWLTPAVLFLAVNLVVATIAVASRLMAAPAPGGDEDEDEAAAGERVARALLRAPSLAVDRLRSSLSFSRLGLAVPGAGDGDGAQPPGFDAAAGAASAPEPALQPPPATEEAEREREEARSRIERSRSEAAAEAAHAADTKRRRARARRAVAAEEEPMAAVEVDARADDFIRRFREQLRLQRLDSILRYRDTLRRTGSAPPE